MAKFKATFNDYSVDLLAQIGMSVNGLIRKIAEEQGAKPVKAGFLAPENATPEWLRAHIEWQVGVALFQRPSENRTINELARRVSEVYGDMIVEWIEENKPNLAEIGFLFAPDATVPGVIQTYPPAQNFAPAAVSPVAPMQPGAQPPAAPGPGFTAIVCRRGRR